MIKVFIDSIRVSLMSQPFRVVILKDPVSANTCRFLSVRVKLKRLRSNYKTLASNAH